MKLNELRKINTSAYTYVVKLKSLLDGIEFENIMRALQSNALIRQNHPSCHSRTLCYRVFSIPLYCHRLQMLHLDRGVRDKAFILLNKIICVLLLNIYF